MYMYIYIYIILIKHVPVDSENKVAQVLSILTYARIDRFLSQQVYRLS